MNKILLVFPGLLLSSCSFNSSNVLSSLGSTNDTFLSSSNSSLSSEETCSNSQSSLDTLFSWNNVTLANMKKVTSSTSISFPIPKGFTNTYADFSYKDESNYVFKVMDFVADDYCDEYFSALLDLGFKIDVSSIDIDKKENKHTLKYSFSSDYGLDSIDACFYYSDGVFTLEAKKVEAGGYYQDYLFPKDKLVSINKDLDSSLVPSFKVSKEYSFYQSYFYTGYGCVYGYIDLEDRKDLINLYNNECLKLGYTLSKEDSLDTYSATKDKITLNYCLGNDNVFYLMIYC